jgi:hypothetical protein
MLLAQPRQSHSRKLGEVAAPFGLGCLAILFDPQLNSHAWVPHLNWVALRQPTRRPLGIDVIRYYVLHHWAGADAFNEQAIISQSLDDNIECLKRLSCRRSTEPLASQWHCCEGLGADRLFESTIRLIKANPCEGSPFSWSDLANEARKVAPPMAGIAVGHPVPYFPVRPPAWRINPR